MTGNMAPKTGNSRLRNHQHQTEKEEKSDNDNPILNSRSLLHLAVPAASNKISSVIFFGTFSNCGIVQKHSLEGLKVIYKIYNNSVLINKKQNVLKKYEDKTR